MASALSLPLFLPLLSPSLLPLTPRLSLPLPLPLFLSLSLLSTERARLAGALRFARGHCTRLQHRMYKTTRGTSLCSWSLSLIIRGTRLQPRTCKTSRGYFASLVVSKKVPATWWDFDFFFFQKIPDFEN